MSKISEMIRKEFGEGDDLRDQGLTIPSGVLRFLDIEFGDDNLLDVYIPKEAQGPYPVIMNVHGGGWVYGDKERYQYYCYQMCLQGFAIINFNYKLAPEYKFPQPLKDINDAVKWLLSKSAFYNLDMKHVFMMGDSAGAHLLSLYCCMYSSKTYASQYDFKIPTHFKITAIALACGVYEIQENSGDTTTPALMEDFLPLKGTPEELLQINALRHITKSYPPVFLMTCCRDFLRGQSTLLQDVLTKKQIPFDYHYYVDEKKSLLHCFHLNVKLEASQQVYKDMAYYFKSFIKSLDN